jgi:acyl-CoA synthetase (NDP forming)
LRRTKLPDLEYIFHPRSIAVVGVSPHSNTTEMFLNPLIQFGYRGKIYPVNPNTSEVSGLKSYPGILDIPGPVDHVTCAIRAALTPQLMRECAAKGVKLVQIFTAGFSEAGQEEGIRLEKEIAEIARQGNMRVLGPNCMGIYYPSLGISYEPFFPKDGGCVGFLSQSGGNSMMLVMLGAARGIRFSKVVSFGNGCDINEADLMDYFAGDPETKIIIGYIEGTRDGRRFAEALQKAAEAKPVILLKGGTTEVGTRAAASHTGALAGNNIIWESLFHQLGVMQVDDMDELIDLVLLSQHFDHIRGKKTGLVGLGGGNSVLAADSCAREGLVVPPFPDKLKRRLREILPTEVDPGTSVRNPVDLSASGWNPDILSQTLEAVDGYDELDFILVYVSLHAGTLEPPFRQWVIADIDALIKTKRNLNKPLVMMLQDDHVPELTKFTFSIQEICRQADIPIFPSFNRGARAMGRFAQYYDGRQCREGSSL